MELRNTKINFLGDSITEGIGTIRFTDLIEQNEGAICRNYGISGTRIAKQTAATEPASFDRDFCSRVGEMDPDAEIIVVFGGTNDYGHGDAPLGTPADRTPETFWGALHTLYSSLAAKYPAAKIVVLTPTHRLDEGNPRGAFDYKPAPVASLREYVSIIREVAEYYSFPVLDLFASSGLQPAIPAIQERFMPDGLHPNNAGHEKLADQIVKFLRAL
ncbi:MAG: SGNH/GDSL hydrolase family protein [Ruminococcaceae bacterium]|nr:SGNH/GDSL hydrolase family protein [Oscillospiraceae bacterium]